MSAEMQLRHYEVQQQQFNPLFQDWDRSFALWYEQFQTYPHKDQLQDYEHQWKQWQEQMNATNAHLQERVASLTAMVPFPTGHYNSGMMGQYGQYPGQDMQMQQQSLNQGVQHSPVAAGPRAQGPRPTGFGAPSESPAGPPVRGGGPAATGVRPSGPPTHQPPNFTPQLRGPRSVWIFFLPLRLPFFVFFFFIKLAPAKHSKNVHTSSLHSCFVMFPLHAKIVISHY